MMKFIKKTDFIIILIICIISLSVWGFLKVTPQKGEVKAEIYYKTNLALTVYLNKGEEKSFSIPQNENVVFHVSEGNICFENSNCPDKVCINTGYINKIGESAACLPNDIILKIVPVGDFEEDDLDIIVGK